MNILWLSWKNITHPDNGGAEIYSEKIAAALVQKGHTVTWISLSYPNSPQQITQNGINYIQTLPKWTYYLGLFHVLVWWKYQTQYKNKIDVVVDEVHGPPLLTPLYVKSKNIMLIHEVAGEIWRKMVPFPLDFFGQYILDPLFFRAYKNTQIITVSESTKRDLLNFAIPEKNIQIIYNGFTAPKIEYLPKEKFPTLIFLSALRPMKGIDRVLAVYEKLKSQIPGLRLWVVGDDTLPYGQEIKNQNKSDTNITFFGSVIEQEKYQLLQKSHILVHGSYKEGWGRVVLEANSVGTPAVVFDAAGLRDSVQHQKTGFISQSDDEFVNNVQKLLSDKELYGTLSSNAKLWAQEFSWGKTIEQALTLIEK